MVTVLYTYGVLGGRISELIIYMDIKGGLNHEVRKSLRQGMEAQPPEAVGCLLMDNLKIANYSIIQVGKYYVCSY